MASRCIEFLNRLNDVRASEHHEILGGTTFDALKAVEQLNISLDEISDIFVFCVNSDAAAKVFFNLESTEMPDTLINVSSPRFVIIKKDGTEYWLEGLNCGYSGTGPCGTEKVLADWGIIEKQEGYINKIIADNSILHFFRDDKKDWKYESELSMFRKNEMDDMQEQFFDVSAGLYYI